MYVHEGKRSFFKDLASNNKVVAPGKFHAFNAPINVIPAGGGGGMQGKIWGFDFCQKF